MCLILLAVGVHPRFPLVLLANRDEFYDRPALPLHWWTEVPGPGILAGRDLRSGGSWLGITRTGRWAAVTNYRDLAPPRPDAPSRGALVTDFLEGLLAPRDHLAALAPRVTDFNGFNLLVGDPREIWWLSNRGAGAVRVDTGLHGLSNALLDTPWPKVIHGRRDLGRLLEQGEPDPETLLDLLLDRAPAADPLLPHTGVGTEMERALSSAFIQTPGYGTRSSTALLIDLDGTVLLQERTFHSDQTEPHTVRFSFSTDLA